MGIVQTLREMLIPDTETGVVYRCTNCGETFDDVHGECPACGSTEIKEEEGFELRPDE